MARIEWPAEIPMPREGCFTTGQYDGPTGKHCLIGWVRVAVPNVPARVEVIDELDRVARRRGRSNVIDFNDHRDTTDADRMAVWDEAVGKFGYERTDEVWP